MEFVGTSFESALSDAGISTRWAPVRSPTYKAVVERFFGTLKTRFSQRLPGGSFAPQQMRAWGLDPQKEAALSLEQAEGLLHHAIAAYHQEVHRTLGEPPLATWKRSIAAQGGIQVIGDDSQFDKMIGAEVERSLTRSGVSLFGLSYHDPVVTGPLLEDLAPREPVRSRRKGSATATVKVKYNPANIGAVHVWNAKRGIFQTLPCTDPGYASGLSKWQHDRIMEWECEARELDVDRRRELRCSLRARIQELTPARTNKKIDRNMARLLSSPKIQQLAADHLRIEIAPARHDGLAPTIPTTPLAPERTDDHVRPVRPARGGSRARRGKAARSSADIRRDDQASGPWTIAEDDGAEWEAFQ